TTRELIRVYGKMTSIPTSSSLWARRSIPPCLSALGRRQCGSGADWSVKLGWGRDVDLTDLGKIMDGAKRAAFRLESLPQYLVPQEEDEFAAWRAGKQPLPRTSESSEWLAE